MLYHAALFLKDFGAFFSNLNVVHYISFRMIAAFLTALCIFFLCGSRFIGYSQTCFRAKAREYTPETHKTKDGVPTMGGLLIIATVLISSLLWCNFTSIEVWLTLGCLVLFGTIGLWDDVQKIRVNKGIPEGHKFYAQLAAGLLIATLWFFLCRPSTYLSFPFFKTITLNIGILLIPWTVFLLTATSNAVNLTDGLDGLAAASLITNFSVFTGLLYIAGNFLAAAYLYVPFTGNAEVAVVGGALIGATLGFLWYNAHPAQIFMGDVGALALGAVLAFIALLAKQEFLLPLTGIIFVVETLSVIIQVAYYKRYKTRLFKMAPLHHHFELSGWAEQKVTTRFTIISIIAGVLALLTLKIR